MKEILKDCFVLSTAVFTSVVITVVLSLYLLQPSSIISLEQELESLFPDCDLPIKLADYNLRRR
jgi:hypothetical protein